MASRRSRASTLFADDVERANRNSFSGDSSQPVSLEKGLGRLMSVRNIRRGASSEDLLQKAKDAKKKPVKKNRGGTIKYGFSLKAREYIAVGFYDQAIALSQKASDVVGWSVALMLSGDAEKAVDIIEAFIIAACLVTYQETHKAIGGVVFDYRQILASIIASPGAPATVDIMQSLPPPTEQLFHDTIIDVCEAANWDELHQWYLTAVLLHPSYTAPANPWLRQFFGLFSMRPPVGKKGAGRSMGYNTAKTLSRADIENILISQCTEIEIHQVNAIVSWRLCRLRSAMRSCTALLQVDPQDIQMRVIRCCCAMQLGERHTVGEDCTQLMQSASMLVSTVGCALATFGIPLESARAAVEQFQATDDEQNFVFSLCEWSHSLTLLQLGQFEAAKAVVEHTMPVAPRRSILPLLLDGYVTCCIALEDSDALLKLPRGSLGPFHQLHLALVPRFGGGYGNDSINKITIASDLGELLNPLNISCYSDAREMMAIHCTTARSLFSFGHLREAWVEACSAVACAEEVIGSATFALSDCAPHRVYFLGCTVGMTVLDRLIEEDEEASKVLSAEELASKRQCDDKLGDDIIATCRLWARMIRDFHPNQVLGHAAITQVSIASHDLDSMERAIAIADQFPDEVITKNAVSYALYSKHLIPDAVAHAQKTLQMFPHVKEVRNMMLAVSGKEGTYTFLYRGMLPFPYGSGEADTTTARLWFAFCVTLLNFVILAGMFLFNLTDWISFPSWLDGTIRSVQVSTMITFYVAGFFFIYSMIATYIQPTLVSVLLTDLHVRNTRLNRFLYSSRGIPWVNVANAVQISVFGNNFGFNSVWYTILLYSTLALLQFPYSSRTFFLRSIDEPRMALPFWVTLVATDFTTFLAMAPLLLLACCIEPFMCVAFHFILPVPAPDYDTGDIITRLSNHSRGKRHGAMGRFSLSSNSDFIHIRIMQYLFYMTHSDMDTFFTAAKQQEADDARAFPLIEVLETITAEALTLPSMRKPIDRQAQQLIHDQRARTNANGHVVEAARSGEGNLAGILDDVTDDGGRGLLDEVDGFEEISLSRHDSHTGSFGTEIMDALNAEFAKLSDQNTQIQKAIGASQSAKNGGSEGKRLGDVGLYKENKERTEMFTTGPMMRQLDARRRASVSLSVPEERREASDAFSSVEPRSPRSMQRKSFIARPGSPLAPGTSLAALATVSSQNELLKGGMNRKQSLFRRPDAVAFSIDDDDVPTAPKSGAAPPPQPRQGGAGLFGTKRASFGLAVDDDSDLSSTDDDEKPARGPQQKNTGAAEGPHQTKDVGKAGHEGSMNELTCKLSGVASALSFSQFAEDDTSTDRTSSIVSTETRGSSSATESKGRGGSFSRDGPERVPSGIPQQPLAKRSRSAVTFVAPQHAANDDETEQLGSTPQSEALSQAQPILVPNASPPPAASVASPLPATVLASPPLAAEAARELIPLPERISPPGVPLTVSPPKKTDSPPPQPRASLVGAGLATTYAVQLMRKKASLIHQRNELLEAGAASSQHSHIASHPEADSSGAGAPRQRRGSMKDMVAQAATPKPSDANSETTPQPTTLQRRQSIGRVPSTLGGSKQSDEFVSELQARPSSTNPAKPTSPKRVSSAPGSRQELQALDSEDEQKAVNGNLKVKKLLEELRYVRSTVQDGLASARAIADPNVVSSLRKQGETAKLKFVAELRKIGTRVSVDAYEIKKQITELFCELVKEGDWKRPGNFDVVSALLATIASVDFAQVIESRRLLEAAVEHGQAKMLQCMMLYKPILTQLTADRITALLTAVQTGLERRCSLLMSLLEFAIRSKVCHSAANQMQGTWQRSLEKVVSLQHSAPNEDRSDLQAMLDVALNHPFVHLDPEVEGQDKQTIFSRACREGDVATVRHLLERGKVREVNRVQGDGTNPLQQAVARNHPEVVHLLLGVRGIASSVQHVFPGKGTVLDIAKNLKRDQSIIDALQQFMPVASPPVSRSSSPRSERAGGSQSPHRSSVAKGDDDASATVKQLFVPLMQINENLEVAIRDDNKGEIARISDSQRATKERIAHRLEALPRNQLAVASREAQELLVASMDALVREGDAKAGNVALVRAIAPRFSRSVSLAEVALQRKWLDCCLEFGSVELFKIVVAIDDLGVQFRKGGVAAAEAILDAATRSTVGRAASLVAILDASTTLSLADHKAMLQKRWQHAVTTISSTTTAKAGESRAQRIPLVKRLLGPETAPVLSVDFETESGQNDHHTIFSRACAGGDLELVTLLMTSGAIKNPNRCQSSGDCALTSAIVANRVEVVEYLASPKWRGSVDVNVATPNGKPMAVAIGCKADRRIIRALEVAQNKAVGTIDDTMNS